MARHSHRRQAEDWADIALCRVAKFNAVLVENRTPAPPICLKSVSGSDALGSTRRDQKQGETYAHGRSG